MRFFNVKMFGLENPTAEQKMLGALEGENIILHVQYANVVE